MLSVGAVGSAKPSAVIIGTLTPSHLKPKLDFLGRQLRVQLRDAVHHFIRGPPATAGTAGDVVHCQSGRLEIACEGQTYAS